MINLREIAKEKIKKKKTKEREDHIYLDSDKIDHKPISSMKGQKTQLALYIEICFTKSPTVFSISPIQLQAINTAIIVWSYIMPLSLGVAVEFDHVIIQGILFFFSYSIKYIYSNKITRG